MNDKHTVEKLSWLNATLEAQRTNLHGALSRFKEFAVRVGSGFTLHKKFMRLMDQVAVEQQKERKIIDQIEAMEKRHRQLKERNLLQRLALEARAARSRRREHEEDDIVLLRRRKKPEEEESRLLELLVWAGVLRSFSRFFDKVFGVNNDKKPEPK